MSGCYNFHNYMDWCFKCLCEDCTICSPRQICNCDSAYGYIYYLFPDGEDFELPAGENDLVFNGNSNLKGITNSAPSKDIFILKPGVYAIHYEINLGNVSAFIKLNDSKVLDSNYIVENSSTILYGQTIIKVDTPNSKINLSINTASPINLENAGKDNILFSILIEKME